MSAGSALAAGKRADPHLAAEAVSKALQRAGLSRAEAVLLYLSPEFCSGGALAAEAVLSAARAAQSMQIAGAVTAGVFTEEGFSLERPCAAALVLGDGLGFVTSANRHEDALPENRDAGISEALPGTSSGLIHVSSPRLSFFSDAAFTRAGFFPEDSPEDMPHLGCISGTPAQSAVAPVWQQGRAGTAHPAHIVIAGADAEILVCHGFRSLGPIHHFLRTHGRNLLSVDNDTALQSLLRELPAALCREGSPPLRALFALVGMDPDADASPEKLLANGRFHALPLLAANPDGSLELGARLPEGRPLFWALRQPETTAAETQTRLASLSVASPSFALAFSCLGRGPFLYDGKDLDLKAFTQRFPGTPLLGAYCVEQVFPQSPPAPSIRKIQNAFTLALFSASLR
ncbi:MAG: FIST C-terminal domain-containing protein [Betaproteobacteria bacterium]|nr:FIST C-terminal domain-containing protein [Betaproteobacteria bacterium]